MFSLIRHLDATAVQWYTREVYTDIEWMWLYERVKKDSVRRQSTWQQHLTPIKGRLH